ncbi:MAG: glycosyltransferase family 2 protein [Candidatus Eisenbacteria bacterium]
MYRGDRDGRGTRDRIFTALGLLAAAGPSVVARRARRYRWKKRLLEVPAEEACRAWLRSHRSFATDPGRLRAVRESLGGLPEVQVAPLGASPVSVDYPGALPIAPAGPLGEILSGSPAEFVVLLRPGWDLLPGGIAESVLRLRRRPEAIALFGDEEIPSAGAGDGLPNWKPGWSGDHFRGSFYTGGVLVLRRDPAAAASRGIAGSGEGALYEVLLRIHERPGAVVHLPEILSSRAGQAKGGGDRACREALARWASFAGRSGPVEEGLVPGSWRIRTAAPKEASLSVLVPTRDGGSWLGKCLSSLGRSSFPPAEIIVVDNGSRDTATLDYLRSVAGRKDVKILSRPGRFRFSALMNDAAREARGDLLLFLNDDTELLEPSSLDSMAAEAVRPDVGAVGPLLLYPDGAVQHAGLVVGMGVVAGHLYKGTERTGAPWFVSPLVDREVSAVDGACLMTRRDLFLRLGGFDDRRLPVSFSDVDFCLRARDEGLRVLYTPHARFTHHEGRTRRRGVDPREAVWMERRWAGRLDEDPFYHPALSLLDEYPRPRGEEHR